VIRFVGGKPGGGKTLFAATKLVEELRTTTRFIVTNGAIEMHPWVDGGGVARKGLKRSMQDKFGDDFDCERRVVLVEDEAVPRFYSIRPPLDLEHDEVVIQTRGKHEDNRFRLKVEGAKSQVGGVCYIIDEAHEFFASRDWMKTGKELLSWASQQRRAGDDAWLLTQVIENVEKQLRGVSQECYWLVNHRLLRAMMFRQPDMISYKLYAKTPPGTNESYLAKGRLSVDRDFIYGIYNTAKGVGVSGRQADIGVRAKGLHWTWLIAFAAALVLGVIAFREGVVMGIGKLTQIPGPKTPTVTNTPASTNRHSLVMQLAAQLGATVGPGATSVPVKWVAPEVVSKKLEPYVVSVTTARIPGGAAVGALLFNDGTSVRATNITEVWKGYAADGRFYSSVPTGEENKTLYRPLPESVKGR